MAVYREDPMFSVGLIPRKVCVYTIKLRPKFCQKNVEDAKDCMKGFPTGADKVQHLQTLDYAFKSL